MSSFLAAAIQLNSQPDLDFNMEHIRPWVEQASHRGAALIALPENFAFMGDEKARLKQVDRISETVKNALSVWAKDFGIYILGGGYPVRADKSKIFNRAVLVSPDGKVVASYDKIHLFDVELSKEESYRESDMVRGGSKTAVLYESKKLANIGLSICYDVRFPELYRKLSEKGAELLCVPAAFTRPTGEAHWEILLRSRAIENSTYLIAPAQTGRHGEKRETYGHSMIVDPWGTVLADAGTDPGMVIAEINLERLQEIRRKLPSLKHRIL